MDPAEYRDARWYALLRIAADLGVPEEDAAGLVQRVLDDHRRAIRRAEDPDPLVQEALREAISPPPPPSSRRRIGLVALAAVLLTVGVGLAVTGRDTPPTDELRSDQVPSLFGYDAAHARALLEARGLDVTIQPFRACEVLGRVVGSDPPTGETFDRGDPVTVFSAVPTDVTCLTDYIDRETAWQLLDFANGRGPAPPFAAHVLVYSGDAEPVLLDGAAATARGAWAGTDVLDELRDASAEVAVATEHPLQYAVPAISVVTSRDRRDGCGVPPAGVAERADAFSMIVRPPGRDRSGVRLDVFRDDGAIESLAYCPA